MPLKIWVIEEPLLRKSNRQSGRENVFLRKKEGCLFGRIFTIMICGKGDITNKAGYADCGRGT
jgi:hypothetical protein